MTLYVADKKIEKVYQGEVPVEKIMLENKVFGEDISIGGFVQTADYVADGVSFEAKKIGDGALASDAISETRLENVYKAGYENELYTGYEDLVIRPYDASIKINVPQNSLSVKINLRFINFPSGNPSTSLNGSSAFWGLYNGNELVVKQNLYTVREYVLNPEEALWDNIRFDTGTLLTKGCVYQINMLKIGGL